MSDDKKSDGGSGLGVVLAQMVTCMLGGLALLGIYQKWMPDYRQLMEHQNMPLPAPTIWMLQISEMVRAWFIFVSAVTVLVPAALVVVPRRHSAWLATLFLGFLLAFALFTIAAAYLPLMKLTMSLK